MITSEHRLMNNMLRRLSLATIFLVLILIVNTTLAVSTPSLIGTIGVNNALAVGVNPNTNRVYVTNYDNGTVTVLDGATNSVITTVPTGNRPNDVGVNPNTNRIYVPNNASGNVTVIDGATNTVIAASERLLR